jgi:hypothetical protein
MHIEGDFAEALVELGCRTLSQRLQLPHLGSHDVEVLLAVEIHELFKSRLVVEVFRPGAQHSAWRDAFSFWGRLNWLRSFSLIHTLRLNLNFLRLLSDLNFDGFYFNPGD